MASRRPRKRQVQQSLQFRFDKNGQRRGVGPRKITKKLGRPPRDPRRPSERHKTRTPLNPRHPQHITLRCVDAVGWLRKRHIYAQVRKGLTVVWRRSDFRIVHFSIQGHHIHLVCEARDKAALAAGVQAFGSSCAQRINRTLSERTGIRRRGCVFTDRYHVRALTNVAQVRNAIVYVLNNFRHHNLDEPTLAHGRVDYYSSGILFMGWKERTLHEPCLPEDYPRPDVHDAETWLLRYGLRRARPISVWEVPASTTRLT